MTDVTPSKVIVVDDHPIVRDGLSDLIERELDLTVCARAENGATAMKLIADTSPDIAVIDLSLDDVGGLQLIKNLRARNEAVLVLVLSMHDEKLYAERALRAGANGYIMKKESPSKVIGAIRKVLKGDVYLSEEMAARVMQQFASGHPSVHESPVDRLSNRELQVFELIGQGFRTGQIAEKLHLSVKTIETYREHLKEKLGLSNATELVQHAIEWVHSENV